MRSRDVNEYNTDRVGVFHIHTYLTLILSISYFYPLNLTLFISYPYSLRLTDIEQITGEYRIIYNLSN